MSLVLYRRRDCTLCELAEQALRDAGLSDWQAVEVGWDGALSARYGWSLPVLRDPIRDRELAWPFDAGSVRAWLAAAEHQG